MRWRKALQILVLLVILVVMAYPLAWMITLSLKTGDGIGLRFYKEVWASGPFDGIRMVRP